MEIRDTMEPEMDDEATMLRVKNGEVKELDVLFRRHSGALFGFFYGMSRDASKSEDLVQEVFWRILRSRESFDEQLSFKGWIFRIARNLYIDRSRQDKAHLFVEMESLEREADSKARSPYQETARKDERDRLLGALEDLTPGQREILVMARFKGMSFRTIGETLGCSEEAAKVRAFRALQALRSLYLSREEGK